MHLVPLIALLLFTQTAADLLRQGLTKLQAGQVQAAQDDLLQASKFDERNGYVGSSLAETHRRLGQRDEGLAAAAKAESIGSADPAVDHALAIFYTAMEMPDKAAALEQRFAESPKADSEAFVRVTQLYVRAGNFAAAAEAGGKAWGRSDKRNLSLGTDYSMALLRLQKFDEAADIAGQGLKTDKDNAQLQLVLGVARYGQRRFEEAIAAFLQVAAIDPAIPQPYLFLGSLLEQAGGHLDQVVMTEGAWAKREPKNAKAQLTYAKALLQKDRRSSDARQLLDNAVRLDGSDWEAHYQLGVYLENARDYAGAAAELKQSIALDPTRALPHYHLARVYDRLGQVDLARVEREAHTRLSGQAEQSK